MMRPMVWAEKKTDDLVAIIYDDFRAAYVQCRHIDIFKLSDLSQKCAAVVKLLSSKNGLINFHCAWPTVFRCQKVHLTISA